MNEQTIPQGLLYSPDHAWARKEADGLTAVGMTRYAADQMGKLVYIDLPASGDHVDAGRAAFDVESAKNIVPFISPVSGEIVQVNDAAADDPAIVNTDPYGEGWLYLVKPDDEDRKNYLVDAAAYRTLTAQEAA